jgi:hypothetical protein
MAIPPFRRLLLLLAGAAAAAFDLDEATAPSPPASSPPATLSTYACAASRPLIPPSMPSLSSTRTVRAPPPTGSLGPACSRRCMASPCCSRTTSPRPGRSTRRPGRSPCSGPALRATPAWLSVSGKPAPCS